MKIVKQGWEFMITPDGEQMIKLLELAGRVCYKSEDKMTMESARTFITKAIKSGHHSVIEHANISVRIITDRGVTHEIVRHRIASYSQESTRYCNYSGNKFGKEITVILPTWFNDINPDTIGLSGPMTDRERQYLTWRDAMKVIERVYLDLIELSQSPQEARSILPNSLKTEIVMTANVREWRHFFTLRCSNAAHPQMRELARDMHKGFKTVVPVIFDDITY